MFSEEPTPSAVGNAGSGRTLGVDAYPDRTQGVLAQIGVGQAIIDPATGLYVQVDLRFCDLVGYSREELLQSSLQNTTHPEDRDEILGLLADLNHGHIPENALEKRLVRRTGGIAWVSIQPPRLLRGAGNTTAHLLLLDITPRKQAEENWKASEKLRRSLFENMLNGFAHCRMLYDDQDRPEDFIYLDVNSAFEALTGLQDVVGKRVSEVIPEIRENDPGLFEVYGRVAFTGEPEKFETYVNALGMWFSISVYCPQKDHFVAIFDVITDRKHHEEAIRTQLEELRRWHEATLGRESRILELKQEVNELLVQSGQPRRYASTKDNEAVPPSDGMTT